MNESYRLLCQLPYRGYEVQIGKALDSSLLQQYCGIVLELDILGDFNDSTTKWVPACFGVSFYEPTIGKNPREVLLTCWNEIDLHYKTLEQPHYIEQKEVLDRYINERGVTGIKEIVRGFEVMIANYKRRREGGT